LMRTIAVRQNAPAFYTGEGCPKGEKFG